MNEIWIIERKEEFGEWTFYDAVKTVLKERIEMSEELNPNHPVVMQVNDHWHMPCPILTQKMGHDDARKENEMYSQIIDNLLRWNEENDERIKDLEQALRECIEWISAKQESHPAGGVLDRSRRALGDK